MAAIRRVKDVQEIEELLERSKERPVWVFKHSLICPLSAAAWAEYRRFVAEQPEDHGLYTVIEIQNARPVSNALAERTGVLHESPQALLLRAGTVAWHASHYGIDVGALKRA